jgi:hypothetical protein
MLPEAAPEEFQHVVDEPAELATRGPAHQLGARSHSAQRCTVGVANRNLGIPEHGLIGILADPQRRAA